MIDVEGAEVGLINESIAEKVKAVVIELHAKVTGSEGARLVRDWLSGQGFQATRDWGDNSVVVYERPSPAAR